MVLSRPLTADGKIYNDPMFAIRNIDDIDELAVFCERHEFNIIEETTDRHDKPLFRLKMDRKQPGWRADRVATVVVVAPELRQAMIDAIVPHMSKMNELP